jgi:hypothetical protein
VEVGGLPVVQPKYSIEIYAYATHHHRSKEAHYIDDEQIFRYCRYLLHLHVFIVMTKQSY